MRYLSVAEIAKKWDVSERSVRNYCAQGRVNGAFLTGKTWNIPENAEKPERTNKRKDKPTTLLDILKEQKASKCSGGIYHKTQIELTYNSNHMEGSRLTHDQTRYIFETNTIGVEKEVLNVDDVIETANHFRCIDMIIDHAKAALTEKFIKELHLVLKNGTSDSRKDWFAVGEYKKLPNEAGGRDTALSEEVADKMKALLTEYNAKEKKTFEDILDFHVKFERIHPFQDGNGRVGRLIMFKECLKYNIVPFIIEDNLKMFYYRGLKEWDNEKGYLTDTCLIAQDKYKTYLDYFEDSFLINRANRYDVKGRKYISTPMKFYFTDCGLRNVRINFRQYEETHIMENIIYNELLIRGYHVDVGMIEYNCYTENRKRVQKQLEVDFVCNQGSKRIYIQSALALPTREKEEQEQLPLQNIGDSFKKIIIVKDGPTHYNESGILILNLFDFLLKENSLEC